MTENETKAAGLWVCCIAFVMFFFGMAMGYRGALLRVDFIDFEFACSPPIAFLSHCYDPEGGEDG